jgi:pheromone shutdown protein TraB
MIRGIIISVLQVNILTDVMNRITFVPVIHTDHESVKRARKIVRDQKPDVVAVELDRQRYQELMAGGDREAPLSMSGDTIHDLMQQLAVLEKNMGDMIGSEVGREMLVAIEEGRAIGAKIALIDRPISETIRAMQTIPLDEIYKLSGFITDVSDEIEEGEAVSLIDLLKEDGQVDNIMEQFKTEFPGLSDVLIRQRDLYVAKALEFLLKDVPGQIVAVLGAGHIEGVKQALVEILQSSKE